MVGILKSQWWGSSGPKKGINRLNVFSQTIFISADILTGLYMTIYSKTNLTTQTQKAFRFVECGDHPYSSHPVWTIQRQTSIS